MKTGDRVRYIKSNNEDLVLGREYTILNASEHLVKLVTHLGGFHPDHFELVTKSKYTTKSIDYTDCDPVISAHLQRNEQIFCVVWDDIMGEKREGFVIAYRKDNSYPYKTDGSLYVNAKPIEKVSKVKKASEIVKWLEDNWYEVDSDGDWVGDGLTFWSEMFQYCRKSKPEKWCWRKEWLE